MARKVPIIREIVEDYKMKQNLIQKIVARIYRRGGYIYSEGFSRSDKPREANWWGNASLKNVIKAVYAETEGIGGVLTAAGGQRVFKPEG